MKYSIPNILLLSMLFMCNCASRQELESDFIKFDLRNCVVNLVVTEENSDSVQVAQRLQQAYRAFKPKQYSVAYLHDLGIIGIYQEAGIEDFFMSIETDQRDSDAYYNCCATFVYYLRKSGLFTVVEVFKEGHRFLVDCYDGDRLTHRIRLDSRLTFLIQFSEQEYILLEQ